MLSATLALLAALPARNAIVAGAAALLAAPVAKVTPAAAPTPLHTVEAAPVLALPTPANAADPILSVIRAHWRAWAAFQVAPDDEAAAAEEAEYEAAMRLLGTACASRDGARTLIRHLRWYISEEADNLLTAGLGGCHLGAQLKARLAEITLFVPESSLPAVIALPPPKMPGRLLSAIEDHRSANLAVNQAVRDYVQAEADGSPDERLLLAIADRASDEEAKALNALLALSPTDAEEVRTLAAYLAEVAQDFDKQTFSAWLFQRFAAMLANAKAQAA